MWKKYCTITKFVNQIGLFPSILLRKKTKFLCSFIISMSFLSIVGEVGLIISGECIPKRDEILVNVPCHVAFIMDGNRRWAKKERVDLGIAYKEGAKTLSNILDFSYKIGINQVTAYAFSMENWARSIIEINEVMDLFEYYLSEKMNFLTERNMKLKVIGDMSKLSKKLSLLINRIENVTKNNDGLLLQLAFSYGGRQEITQAVKKIANLVKNGDIQPDDINEKVIYLNMYTNDVDPDLIIRTSGEKRLSNYLLWQCAYTELFFCDKLWPDFTTDDFKDILIEYSKRDRRMGKSFSENSSESSLGSKNVNLL